MGQSLFRVQPPKPANVLLDHFRHAERWFGVEWAVLVLLDRGLSNPEIAVQLVSEHTAKTHVSSVLTKIGLRDRLQAVICAYESGLTEPGQWRR